MLSGWMEGVWGVYLMYFQEREKGRQNNPSAAICALSVSPARAEPQSHTHAALVASLNTFTESEFRADGESNTKTGQVKLIETVMQ